MTRLRRLLDDPPYRAAMLSGVENGEGPHFHSGVGQECTAHVTRVGVAPLADLA